MPVRDISDGDVYDGTEALVSGDSSIYDSSWGAQPGNDGYSATVNLPTDDDLRDGTKAAQRKACIKAVSFFAACACAGGGAAFMVTREIQSLSPPPTPNPPPQNCLSFQLPGNTTAMCNHHDCNDLCLNASDTGHNCPFGCTCTATCSVLGEASAPDTKGNWPAAGSFKQTCSPPAGAGEWSDAYVSKSRACVDFDECSSSPCLNGATCTGLGIALNSYHCTCPAGVTGKDCEHVTQVCPPGGRPTAAMPNPCHNNGVCRQYPSMQLQDPSTPISPGEWECDCSQTHNYQKNYLPFSGKACDVATSACESLSPCLHGGTCSDIQGLVSYRCACPGGYAGQNCDQDSTAALANYNTLTTVLALAAQSDSAEENNANGDVTTDSADLNVMTDDHAGHVQQTIGLRFPNVTVRTSQDILTSTYISFKVKEVNPASSRDVSLKIYVQWHSDAPTFDSTNSHDVSGRIPAGVGLASGITWNPPVDHAVGDIVKTPDLHELIQNLVSNSARTFPDGGEWQSGQAIVFILVPETDSGNGTRWYESFSDGSPSLTFKKLDLAHPKHTAPVTHSCAATELSIMNGMQPACYHRNITNTVPNAGTYDVGVSCTVSCCEGFHPSASAAALDAQAAGMNGVKYTCTQGAWVDKAGKGPDVTCDAIDVCTPNPCENDGSCAQPPAVGGGATGSERCLAVAPYSCSCVSGWEGDDCESNHDDCTVNGNQVCEHHAHCTDGLNTYTCQCPKGYSGVNCHVDINECESSPCQNGAPCVDSNTDEQIAPDAFHCNCAGTYSGDECELEQHECDSSPCTNGGTCAEAAPHFQCTCAAGFEDGAHHICENNIDECASAPCQNNGDCSDDNNRPSMAPDTFACNCTGGWVGEVCANQEDVCQSSPCVNGASCTVATDATDGASAVYRCDCATGFSGDNCADAGSVCNAAHTTPLCKNGGTCVDDTTLASKYSCDCGDSGFSGRTCNTNHDDCPGNDCKNGIGHDADGKVTVKPGGTCIDGIHMYTCSCHAGFGGKFCTHPMSECTKGDNPCLNSGTCTDAASNPVGFTCHCDATHHGATCESEVNLCSPNPCGAGLSDNACTQSGATYSCACPPAVPGIPGQAFYKPSGASSKTCAPCPSGKRPNRKGAEKGCENCPAGKAGNDGTCQQCDDGQGPSKDRLDCVACSTGKATKTAGSGICAKCDAGHKPLDLVANHPELGSTGCHRCVKEEAGSGGMCYKCAAGKEPHADHTACEPCAAGKAGDNGMCKKCKAAEQPDTGADTLAQSCVKCGDDMVSADGVQCIGCPPADPTATPPTVAQKPNLGKTACVPGP